jgi:branched-subunit amino acid ABC-type transport system permease component
MQSFLLAGWCSDYNTQMVTRNLSGDSLFSYFAGSLLLLAFGLLIALSINLISSRHWAERMLASALSLFGFSLVIIKLSTIFRNITQDRYIVPPNINNCVEKVVEFSLSGKIVLGLLTLATMLIIALLCLKSYRYTQLAKR